VNLEKYATTPNQHKNPACGSAKKKSHVSFKGYVTWLTIYYPEVQTAESLAGT
jgi:hypothetical protein